MSHILFLYATEHSGHKRAAEAIRKSLSNFSPAVESSGVGFFTQHYPILGPLLFRLYVDLMQSVPNFWDYLYNSDDVASLTEELRSFFHSFNLSKLNATLAKTKPDAVVCTQAIPASFIAQEKRKGHIRVPLIAVVTDFVANPYWPSHDVDCYCVPAPEIKEQLLSRNINEKRIVVTGIPIDSSFIGKIPKDEARLRLGLNPFTPTVLLMGGNHGLGQISSAVKRLARTRKNLQIIVIAGYNRQLYRQLTKSHRKNKNIQIFSHVKNISRLMDASDILISKPGGLTSSEAMSKLLPMIVLAPLPGQEQRNASYLKRHGVAERCDNLRQLPQIVENLLEREDRIKNIQRNALKVSRPYASNFVAEQILRFVNHRERFSRQ